MNIVILDGSILQWRTASKSKSYTKSYANLMATSTSKRPGLCRRQLGIGRGQRVVGRLGQTPG